MYINSIKSTKTFFIDRLKKVYFDGDFTREEYLTENQSIEVEQKTLENKIAELSTDNKEIEISLKYLLDLTSRVNSLYESSRIENKRNLYDSLNFYIKKEVLKTSFRKFGA